MNQKKSWTVQEDETIRRYVKQTGDRPRWKYIAEKVNQLQANRHESNKRTSKQCRQRWHNRLDPNIQDKQWDQQEINKLFQLHNVHGNKWSLIATEMKGRTDNCIKNKFYSALRKGMRKINKYIVNLKRKLSANKNTCIKEFKDVVLTKLIAVADKKYQDRLDVKEHSKSKTEKLSQDIKMALVRVSDNKDDYQGHVKNGIADDDYQIQQKLFKDIQEFCRNCKRKKGKRRDSDQEGENSQMIDESEIIQEKFIQVEEKIQFKQGSKANSTLMVSVNKTKSTLFTTNFFEGEKISNVQNERTFQDLNEQSNSLKGSVQLRSSPNFTLVQNQQQKDNPKTFALPKMSKIAAKQNNLFEGGFRQTKPSLIDDSDFLMSIRCVNEPIIEFQKTDLNNKQPQNFRVQEIFLQCHSSPSPLEASNNISLASSNANCFGQRSGSLGFLGKSGNYMNPFDFVPGAVYISSSYSSSSNKQQQKMMEIMQSNFQKNEKKEERPNLQRSSQNIQLYSSFQLQDLFRRASQRQ